MNTCKFKVSQQTFEESSFFRPHIYSLNEEIQYSSLVHDKTNIYIYILSHYGIVTAVYLTKDVT